MHFVLASMAVSAMRWQFAGSRAFEGRYTLAKSPATMHRQDFLLYRQCHIESFAHIVVAYISSFFSSCCYSIIVSRNHFAFSFRLAEAHFCKYLSHIKINHHDIPFHSDHAHYISVQNLPTYRRRRCLCRKTILASVLDAAVHTIFSLCVELCPLFAAISPADCNNAPPYP